MKKILLLFLSCFLFACSQNRVVPFQKSNLTVGFIKKYVIEGKTSQAEITELFGAPNLITTNSNGNEVWNYSKSSYGASGNINNSNYVLTNASTSSFDFIIIFDKHNIVKKYKMISAAY